MRASRTPLFLVALLAACSAPPAETPPAETSAVIHPEIWPALESAVQPDPEIERRAAEILAKMTLEEKVGQILQAEILNVTPEEVRDYHLGSVLNGGNGGPGGDEWAPAEKWLELADAFWEASMDGSDGFQTIPILWGLDAVHGHTNLVGATIFPHNIGLGAARNPDLIRQVGEVTAKEIAVTGQDWDFSPTVAVARDDRWGRSYESYSEDPEVVASYAGEMVEGLQGAAGSDDFLSERRVIATAKHFVGDGGTWGGADQGDNRATEEELRDIHAAGYTTAIEAGVQTVMASYNSWHGRKLHGYGELLTDVLKGQMGFDGFVVGDWNGHGQVAGCTPQSCAASVNAGLDMFMIPEDWRELYANTLAQAQSGEIPMARLDDAVTRILRVKLRAGLFERGKPSSRELAGRVELLGAPEHRAVARQAVRESLVLLKNSGAVLPLDPTSQILLAGDGADDVEKQSGGWTLTWQGTGNDPSHFEGSTSIWEGFREAIEAAGGTATLSPDGSWSDKPDAAVVVFGEDPYAEFMGDRDVLDYQPEGATDLELLQKLQTDGIPVISVFLSGRPMWVNPEINASDAFVAAWLPGSEGDGVAEVLLATADGSVNHDFRGRLPFSWPNDASGAPVNVGDDGYDPLFAFGYGLSYGDDGELAALSEEDGIDRGAIRARTVYFAGGPVDPWTLYVGDAADWSVPVEGSRGATANSENLTVRAIDRNQQEDARRARWSGDAMAQLYLQAQGPIDLRRESNGEMALAFDVQVIEPPAGSVTLRADCGYPCSGAVDLTETLSEMPRDSWTTVRLRLSCLAAAGADMTRIDTPFLLATDGALELAFSDVRLVAASDGETICPGPPEGDTD